MKSKKTKEELLLEARMINLAAENGSLRVKKDDKFLKVSGQFEISAESLSKYESSIMGIAQNDAKKNEIVEIKL